jgi:hypothetical protein
MRQLFLQLFLIYFDVVEGFEPPSSRPSRTDRFTASASQQTRVLNLLYSQTIEPNAGIEPTLPHLINGTYSSTPIEQFIKP